MRKALTSGFGILAALVLLSAPARLHSQARASGPPPTAKQAAPIDLTGYWTAVITEDYQVRMLPAARGGQRSPIPYRPKGVEEAMKWDPERDAAEGNQCKAFGAPGLMRQPTHLHISWQDENTLKVEADFGMQTRVFHFAPPPQPGRVYFVSGTYIPPQPPEVEPPAGLEPSLQGYSIAPFWKTVTPIVPGQGGELQIVRNGDLRVVTTHLKPGYYFRNGTPYSGDAVLTEHFRVINLPDRSAWLIVTQIVEDPEYLTQPFVVNHQFKKLPDGSKWNPTPCSIK